jgi:hypothetical protein
MCWQSTDAQHIRFESAVGSHPQPLAPAALASASRAQHALALRGAGPPQHESVFCSLPARVSVIAALDIVIPLIEVSTRRSPANDEDAGRRKRTQRLVVWIRAAGALRSRRRITCAGRPAMKIGDAAATSTWISQHRTSIWRRPRPTQKTPLQANDAGEFASNDLRPRRCSVVFRSAPPIPEANSGRYSYENRTSSVDRGSCGDWRRRRRFPTVLSFSLEVEIEGRWPWARTQVADARPGQLP